GAAVVSGAAGAAVVSVDSPPPQAATTNARTASNAQMVLSDLTSSSSYCLTDASINSRRDSGHPTVVGPTSDARTLLPNCWTPQQIQGVIFASDRGRQLDPPQGPRPEIPPPPWP